MALRTYAGSPFCCILPSTCSRRRRHHGAASMQESGCSQHPKRAVAHGVSVLDWRHATCGDAGALPATHLTKSRRVSHSCTALTMRLPNLVASVTFSRRSLMALPARGQPECLRSFVPCLASCLLSTMPLVGQ